ncbi:MAG TPA: tetratricopeptide repeat protein [Chloroflexota bacterium]
MSMPARNAPCPCGSGKKFKLCCISGFAAPIQPQSGIARTQAALAAFQAGDLAGADALCGRILEGSPRDIQALNLRGVIAHAQGRYQDALAVCTLAVETDRRIPESHNNLGNALYGLERHAEALVCYDSAIRLRAGYVEAHSNRGNVLQSMGDLDGAVACFQEALRLNPRFAQALNNLGNALQLLEREGEAARAYELAIMLEPNRVETHANLGKLYQALNRAGDARDAFAAAVRLNPSFTPGVEGLFDLTRMQCAWDDLEKISDLYSAALHRIVDLGATDQASPFSALALPLSLTGQKLLVERVGEAISAPLKSVDLPPLPDGQGVTAARLRVGYLTADYRAHATAHLLGHLFAQHDRFRFEVFAYSTGPDDQSDYRRRFEREAEHFVELQGWTPSRIANRIRADQVDILVDLHGHTKGHSLPALTLRPAPLQLHFLGYPGTIGKAFVDYSLVDNVVCPPGHEVYYSERVYRLPDVYQINDHQPIADLLPRDSYGLPAGGFVFCCFNTSYKLTPAILAVWLRILDRVPNSLLWLHRSSEQAERNLRMAAEKLGCPTERLVLGATLPKDQHLARLQHADLMLDTPIVNAMTTASDALWAGVPVLSVLGDSFAGRAGASILTAIGLPELIMPDLTAYEETAVRLATHPQEMAALKAKLAANRLTTPLFDTPWFVRNLEAAYEELWLRRLAELDAQEGRVLVTAARAAS